MTMDEKEITALAREYAEEATKADAGDPNLSATDLNGIKHDVAEYAEEVIRFLLRRYCLVEKSKTTALCRLTLEHGDSVDYGLIDGLTDIVCELFPEQYEQEARNPEIAKEVEG